MDSQESGAASGAMAGASFGPWGAVIGGVLGYLGSEETNQANSAQSQAQMDFQERMSNTAYQRAVADMKAAGLNPMLAYSQGGASQPGGAQAVMQNSSAAGVSAAMAVRQGELTEAQTAKTRAETVNTEAEAAARIDELKSRAMLGLSSSKHVDQLAFRARQFNNEDGGAYEGRHAFERYALDRAERKGVERFQEGRSDYSTPHLSLMRSHERALTASALLDELDSSRGRVYSDFYKGPLGRSEPEFNMFRQGLSSANDVRRAYRPLGRQAPVGRGGVFPRSFRNE